MDSHILLSLFHLFAVVPLFLFVALSRASTPIWVYTTLLVLGFVLVFYHGYKSILRMKSGSSYLWVNLIHALLIGPLLLFIGFKGRDTGRPAYEMLALVAFSALGYHLYNLIVILNTVEDKKDE